VKKSVHNKLTALSVESASLLQVQILSAATFSDLGSLFPGTYKNIKKSYTKCMVMKMA